MAKERNLPSKTTLTTSDFIRVVGSDNASYKQSINSLGLGATLASGTDLNTLTLPTNERRIKVYHGENIKSMTNVPDVNGWPFCLVLIPIGTNNIYTKQILHIYSTAHYTDNIYVRGQIYSNSQIIWTDWEKQPTRAEINALNTATQTYTPTFSWSDGTTPTVTNEQFSYTKIGKLCWLSGRFQITNKGSVGNSASLLISLPSGISPRGLTPSNIGTFTPNTFTEPPLFIVRVNDSTTISIGWGAGGGYSSPKISAQYYTVFAVVPLE